MAGVAPCQGRPDHRRPEAGILVDPDRLGVAAVMRQSHHLGSFSLPRSEMIDRPVAGHRHQPGGAHHLAPTLPNRRRDRFEDLGRNVVCGLGTDEPSGPAQDRSLMPEHDRCGTGIVPSRFHQPFNDRGPPIPSCGTVRPTTGAPSACLRCGVTHGESGPSTADSDMTALRGGVPARCGPVRRRPLLIPPDQGFRPVTLL